jgi:hypothetical protein
MAKIIVFCADGTWNGPGEPDSDDKTSPPTNVFKLFLNLAGTDTPDTLAYRAKSDPLGTAHRPWEHGIFLGLAKGPRDFPPALSLARSVLSRMAGGNVVPDPGALACFYDPSNLTGYITAGRAGAGVRLV